MNPEPRHELTGETVAVPRAVLETIVAASHWEGPLWRGPAHPAELLRRWLEAAAATAGDAWQPIATAPRDGTRILLSDGREVTGGRWMQGAEFADGREVDVEFWSSDSGNHMDWVGGPVIDNPTLWRPLPRPPA